MLDEIARRVSVSLGEEGRDLGPARLQWSLYSNSGGARSSVVGFCFAPDEGDPRMVVKLSRTRGPIEREYDALARLFAAVGARVARPYMMGEIRGFSFLAMQPLRGRAMTARELERHFGSVLAVLLELHRATGAGAMRPEDFEREMLQPLGEFEQAALGGAPELAGLCRGLWMQIRELARLGLPRVAQHGDFGLRNILLGPGDNPVVVDWEEFGGVQVPAYDLVVLFATLEGRGPWGEASLRRLLAEGLRLYARGLGFDPGWFRALVPWHLLRFWLFCRTEERQRAADLILARLQALARRLERGEAVLP